MKQFVLMITILLCLLFFNNAVITGTQNGLLLWYQTLIPSLLPFILVTNALSETNAYQAAANHFQKWIPFRIYEIMAILLGNLCGYPIGGKILNDFVKNHCVSPERSHRILALASQASPMFLIGYVYTHIVQEEIPLFIFLVSIYLPVIIYYPFLCIHDKKQSTTLKCAPASIFSIRDTFIHAVEVMVMIGIYVIIFSILLVILLPFCHNDILKILLSFLEITNGLQLLNSIHMPDTIRLSFLCCLSAFGGLCSAFQIMGVLEYKNDGIKKYLLDKSILSAGTFGIIYLYLIF